MRSPTGSVVERDPPQGPIRYLTVEDLVVVSGTTSLAPTLEDQVEQIGASIGTNLREAGSDPALVRPQLPPAGPRPRRHRVPW